MSTATKLSALRSIRIEGDRYAPRAKHEQVLELADEVALPGDDVVAQLRDGSLIYAEMPEHGGGHLMSVTDLTKAVAAIADVVCLARVSAICSRRYWHDDTRNNVTFADAVMS